MPTTFPTRIAFMVTGLVFMRPEDLPEDQTECSICWKPFCPASADSAGNATDAVDRHHAEPRSNQPGDSVYHTTEAMNALEELHPTITRQRETATPTPTPDSRPEYALQLPCIHIFGTHCIVQWLCRSNFCPMCRHVLFPALPRAPRPILGRSHRIWARINMLRNMELQLEARTAQTVLAPAEGHSPAEVQPPSNTSRETTLSPLRLQTPIALPLRRQQAGMTDADLIEHIYLRV